MELERIGNRGGTADNTIDGRKRAKKKFLDFLLNKRSLTEEQFMLLLQTYNIGKDALTRNIERLVLQFNLVIYSQS